MDLIILIGASAIVILGWVLFHENILDPLTIFAALGFLMFIVRPAMLLLDLDTAVHPWLFHEETKSLAREALVIFCVGYISFLVGYSMRTKLVQALGTKFPGYHATAVSFSRLRTVLLVVSAASGVVLVYFIVSSGGFSAFVYKARHGLFAGMYLFQKVPQVAALVGVFYLLVAISQKRRLVNPVLLSVGAISLPGFIGDRSAILYAFITMLGGYHLAIRRFPMLKVIRLGGILLLGLFSMGIIRSSLFSRKAESFSAAFSEQYSQQKKNRARSISKQLNLVSVDHFMVVIQDFGPSNYRYGEDFYLGTVGAVPRYFWRGKPETINTGGWWRDRYMPGTGGKPFTAVGIWFVNFGYLGVILGMWLSGVICRASWEYMKNARYAVWAVVLYFVIVLFVLPLGNLVNTLAINIMFWYIPFWLIFRYVLIRGGAASQRPRVRLSLSLDPDTPPASAGRDG